MPRHKPVDINEEPRPQKSKIPVKVSAPLDDYKIPSKPLKNTNPMLNKKSSPLEPLEENTYYTPPSFESQVPSSGFNEDDSENLNLTTFKPRIQFYNDDSFTFYNPNTTFESQTPTTNIDDDDIPRYYVDFNVYYSYDEC